MKYFFSILLFHFYLLFNAQITYTKIPLDLQLVARDKVTNLGNVTFEGTVDITSNFVSLRVETYRNDLLLNTNDKPLNFIDSKAVFSFNISILAELANYSFKIYGYNLSDNQHVLDKTVSNIVAGDAIIIQGQSNAVAPMFNGSANANQSEFIRVYANGTPNIESLMSNDTWYVANGNASTTVNGNTGQWGLKLARLLLDDLGIPIAVFNGAHSGRGITFFKAPQDYKTSLISNYGRLYYRLNKSELKNSVRAVFWSQGEANSGSDFMSISNYKNNFKTIENSLLTDFPNIEKFYIFQTKDCICYGNVTPEGLINTKEAQRQLTTEDPKISIMPTTSLLLNGDLCHFPFKKGYESFATRIHKLVLQDIYGKSYPEEIKAPMIKSVEFTAPNTLVLETDAIELKFSSTDQATMLTRLKQDFELRNAQNTTIESVNLSTNKIIFTLSGNPGPIANISFVGYNSNIGYTITNSSDLELISFRNFPIKNLSINGGENSNYPIIDNAHICTITGSTTTISVLYPNPNASYKWFYKIPNGNWTEITSSNASTVYSNYNSPILEIKKSSSLPISGTIYRVVADNKLLGEFTSNEVTLTFDIAPVSKLITGNLPICAGDNINLVYGNNSIGTIQWQYSTSSSLEDFIDLYAENQLTYSATNLQQTTWFRVINSNGICSAINSPAVQVIVSPQAVAGFISGGNVIVCKTTNSTILSLKNHIGKIQWQKSSTLTGTYTNIASANLNSYTASGLTSSTYFRAVLSSSFCTTQITEPVLIQVESASVSKTISGASAVCLGESKTLTYGTGSIGTIQWQFSTESSLSGFVTINGENGLIYTATNLQQTTWFRVMNSNGECTAVYSPAVQVIVNPAAVAGFISGGNVNVCRASNSTVLSLNNYVGKIQWQKSSTISGDYTAILYSNSPLYTASNLTTTTYFRAVLSNGVCTPQITESVGIQVESAAVSKTISGASAVCFGDSKTLTYDIGSVGTIQWQFSTISSSSGFINLIGENNLIYKTTNLEQTTWFRVVNTIGNCSTAYSPAVQVTVNSKPVVGFITGGNVNVCKSLNSTVLNLNNSVGNPQWQKSSSLSGTYTNVSSTTNQYTASGLTTTTYFRVILTSGICSQQSTEPIFIEVDEPAIAKTIAEASAVCYGDSKILVYETGSAGTIQWEYSNTSNSTGFIGINNENKLILNTHNLQSNTWFRVKNSNGSCPNVYSPSIQVVVNQKPISGDITGGNISVCKSSNSTVLKLQNYAGTVQWQKSSTITGTYSNISSATSSLYTASGLTTTTYFRAILSSGMCPVETTVPVAINIPLNEAVAKTISGASSVCAGDNLSLNYEQGSLGNIQWQFSTSSSASGYNDINGANGQEHLANNLQQTTWFRVKNSIGNCSTVYSPSVQVMVNLKPIAGFISGGNINVCKSSNATSLALNKSLGTIQWQKYSNELGTYSNITSSNSTLYNVSGLQTSHYFRALLSNGVCTAQTTEPVYINVDEPAVAKTITGAAPICFGESKTLFYESGSVGTIQWQYSITSNTSGFTDKIDENELTYTANNLQQTTWFRVKNTSGVCPINYSPPVQILVNTTPQPFGSKTQYFDFNNPVSVSNLVLKGADAKWYSTYSDALSKTNDLQSSTTLTLGSTYYATQTLNGCVSISPLAITVTDTLEIEGFNLDNLEFYPNPFTNYFKLKYPEIMTSLEFYNSLGQSVLKTNINLKETTLDVNNLPSGIYFMELTTKNSKGIIKAIKL